jgi:hypothetical protein
MSEILFYVVIFLANIIQGITGFAGTILAMPFSIHLVGYDVAKPVLNFLGIVAGIYVVLGGYKNINKKELKRVSVFMAGGILIGILVKHLLSGHDRVLYLALGIFVLIIGSRGLISIIKFTIENQGREQVRTKGNKGEHPEYVAKGMTPSAVALLVVAGVVHGIFVSGGPLIISYLSNHTNSKEEFRRTVSAVWIVLNTIIFVSDIMAGYYTMETIRVQAISLPFLFGGMAVGGVLYKHMSQAVFTILTYLLLCLAGVSMIMK